MYQSAPGIILIVSYARVDCKRADSVEFIGSKQNTNTQLYVLYRLHFATQCSKHRNTHKR